MNNILMQDAIPAIKAKAPKGKILFAHFPMDGHFNPLTPIAAHLKEAGYDVRWYSGTIHEEKIKKMGIQVYPFKKAVEVNQFNLEELFPERKKHTNKLKKLKFDVVQAFILRAPEYYQDIRDIYDEFQFDVLVCDIAFTGAPLVRDLLKVKVASIGVLPLSETSKDLAPSGIGMTPPSNWFERLKCAGLRGFLKHVVFKEPMNILNRIFQAHGIAPFNGMVFDVMVQKCDILLQSGCPGFEYKRSDMSPHVRFVGPLLPVIKTAPKPFAQKDKLKGYRKVILATQGTVERDIEKLLVPTLEAFKDRTDCAVVVTTGGHHTALLRAKFPQEHFIIEDFIDFREIMPLADVYVTNGGYGGVMLGIEHGLPLVVAGVNEGKNEINARIGYFGLGIDLKTETPQPAQLQLAITKVLSDTGFKKRVAHLKEELANYPSTELCERYIAGLIQPSRKQVLAMAN